MPAVIDDVLNMIRKNPGSEGGPTPEERELLNSFEAAARGGKDALDQWFATHVLTPDVVSLLIRSIPGWANSESKFTWSPSGSSKLTGTASDTQKKAALDALREEAQNQGIGIIDEDTTVADYINRISEATGTPVTAISDKLYRYNENFPKDGKLGAGTAYQSGIGAIKWKTTDTTKSIADSLGISVGELEDFWANVEFDPKKVKIGDSVPVPISSDGTSKKTGRIGEQTMPQSNPDAVNPDDPNNPGSTDTPGGGGLQPGELEKGDPWLNSLYEDSFGTDKLGRLIDELITNKDYTPGTSSRYERLLRKNAGLLEFGLQMDPASADTGMGTAIAGLMDQIRGGQGIDAWSLINQAAGGDPEYRASFEGDGFDPSNVASILALARSGMVPDEALRSLYQGDYITGLYNDWERTNQGQGDMGTFLAYLMSKGL